MFAKCSPDFKYILFPLRLSNAYIYNVWWPAYELMYNPLHSLINGYTRHWYVCTCMRVGTLLAN